MYDYNIFLNILTQTKGLNNSLNQILKYDFIYHFNKIDGSNFTIETLQLLAEKKIVSGTHNLDDVYISFNSFIVMDLVLDFLNTPLTLERIIEWFKALIQRTKIGDSEIELYNREAEDWICVNILDTQIRTYLSCIQSLKFYLIRSIIIKSLM